MLALGCVLGCALLLGLLLDRALLGDPGQGPIERGGRALTLGLGGCGALSMLVDGLGLGVSRASVGGALALVVLLCAVACWRRSTPRVTTASVPPATGIERLCVVLLLLGAAFGLALAVRSGYLRQTFQFDALARWMWKAKALAVDGTLLGPLSTDPAFGMTHQRYPPLVSHVANLVQLVTGRFDDRLGAAIFPWYAVGLVGLVYGAVSRHAGRLSGALAAFWVANLPMICFLVAPPPGAGAASALADVPLALFITASLLAAHDALDGQRDRAHLEAGVLLGLATLTKNEGLPLVAGLGVGFLLFSPRARWRRALGVCGTGLLIHFACWGVVAASLPITDEHYPAQLTLERLAAGGQRLAIIVPRVLAALVDLPAWNLTWVAVLVLLVVGAARLRRPGIRLVLAALLLQLVVYVGAYVITAWTSPAAEEIAGAKGEAVIVTLMKLTLDRLLVHLAPAAIFVALLCSPVAARRSG